MVVDARILALLLRIARLRTAEYETALLLAQNLGAHQLTHILLPRCGEDAEADDRAARAFATMVGSEEEEWEAAFGLHGGAEGRRRHVGASSHAFPRADAGGALGEESSSSPPDRVERWL